MFTKNQIVRFAQLQIADSTRLLVMATASAGGGQRRKRAWRKPREAMGPPSAADGDTSAHKAARTIMYPMQSQTEGGVSMSGGSGGQTGPVQSESAQHVPVEPCMSSRDAPIEIDGSAMEGVRAKNGSLIPRLLPCFCYTLYKTESHSQTTDPTAYERVDSGVCHLSLPFP